MKALSYSVAIRTLGTAGEKYEKLLKSIQRQTVQPEKIIVVLPEGYKIPAYKLGVEEFVFSKKGMIPQRLKALQYIKSEYVWFCDDDIEVEPEYIEKISKVLYKGYDCAAGPLLDFFPPKTFKYLCASILGGACVMVKDKTTQYVRLLRTGGWSYNRDIDLNNSKIYNTESMPGTNFIVNTKIVKKIRMEDECWAEKIGFSAFEDRIMIAKLVVNGYKCCIVSDALYLHNDGRTSVQNMSLEPLYAASFNHFIFWYRYIYSLGTNSIERGWMKICINYYICMGKIYSIFLRLCGRRTKEQAKISAKGFSDAKRFVKSEEYKKIPDVIIKR